MDGIFEFFRSVGIDKQGRVARDFGHARCVARYDGTSASHGLENGEAKPFVHRGITKEARSLKEADQLCFRHVALEDNVVLKRAWHGQNIVEKTALFSDDHQFVAGLVFLAECDVGIDDALEIFSRLQSAHREDEILFWPCARFELIGNPFVDDVNFAIGELKNVHEVLLGAVADRDKSIDESESVLQDVFEIEVSPGRLPLWKENGNQVVNRHDDLGTWAKKTGQSLWGNGSNRNLKDFWGAKKGQKNPRFPISKSTCDTSRGRKKKGMGEI